jgi:hypothetical protein
MKTSMVAIVLAAFLMVVAGVGFGIAQAGETHPAGEVMKQQSPQAATSPADDVRLEKPIETGRLPSKDDVVVSKVQIDGRTYSERIWKGDIDGH